MDTRDIAQTLESFLRRSFHIADDDPGFDHAVDLFAAGYVDSIGVIETLGFITERFGVTVPDEALLSGSFATIAGMAEVIASLVTDTADQPAVDSL
jgi:acyl carrier protein